MRNDGENLSYRHRQKKKIQDKIDGIGSRPNTLEKKLRKVEMLDREKGESVGEVLKLKEKANRAPPRLRIIRSGLPIRLSEVELRPKSRETGLTEN